MRAASTVGWVSLALLVACASPMRKGIEIPLPPPASPVPRLLEELGSSEASVRAAAAWQIAAAKEHQQEALSALNPLRDDPDRSVRYAAAWAAGHLRQPTKEPSPSKFDETPPKALYQEKPKYPDSAFNARIQGTVLVEVLVGEEGEVARAELRISIPELDAAAMACVRNWRFEPMRRAGIPRATIVHVPVTFRVY